MKFFNLFLVSGLALTIVACDTKRNPYFSDDNAQFYVGDIKDDKLEEKTDEAGAVYGARIAFVACLKTLAGSGIPPRVKFEVHAGKDIITATTNKDGCIEWTEDHEFEPIQDERNLRLVRTFVSRNDYSGRVQQTIYWNMSTNKIVNDISTKTPPQGVEDPIEQSFTMRDAHVTVQSLAAGNTVLNSNGGQTVTPKSSTSLVLSSINLTRVKMSQDPFKIDRNLTLHVQHTYEVSASPKFFIKTFKNARSAVALPGGKYKLTLVFMDDPGFDLKNLPRELNKYKTADSLNSAQTNEGKSLKTATELMISKKEIKPDQPLSEADRKKILTTVMLRHVHSTAQFIADKAAAHDQIIEHIDLQLKKLASLDVRSVLAISVENVSTGQKQKLKGHGTGYINNLIEGGNVTLFESPIEADLIYSAYTLQRIQMENMRPLDLYLQASTIELKERALAPLDTKDLSEIRDSSFKGIYPFSKELENFLANNLDAARKYIFLRALCTKMFSSEQLKSIDTVKHAFQHQNRQGWIDKCAYTRMKYFHVEVLDFVESVDDAKVSKVGKSEPETITISTSFSMDESKGQSSSNSHDHWSIVLGNFLIDGVIETATAVSPFGGKLLGTGISYAKGFIPLSVGGDWYWASSQSRSKNQSASISRGSSESLLIDINTYKITTEARRCAIISYEPWVSEYFSTKENIKLRKGFITCAAKTIRPTYNEKYYVVTQDCSEKNGMTDCTSDEETKLRVILRGEQVYNQFTQMMVNKNTSVLLNPMQPDVLVKQRTEWKNLMDAATTSQIFPGALAPVMN